MSRLVVRTGWNGCSASRQRSISEAPLPALSSLQSSVPVVAPLFDWTLEQQTSAALFGAVLLLTTGATATGMLRLFDRFDLVAYAEAIGPLVRLGGSIVAWLAGANVETFLIIWASAAVAQALAQWIAAVVVNRARIAFGRRHFRQAVQENERVWRFMLQTNVSNSVGMFWMQLGTLAVGAVAGAAEAGAFRLAQRLSKGIVRPVRPVTLALYPELSRLVAEDDHAQLRSVVLRLTIVAAALAFLVVLVTGIAGREILGLIAGERFEFAYAFLFLLSIATAIDLAGFAFEPLQDAHGRVVDCPSCKAGGGSCLRHAARDPAALVGRSGCCVRSNHLFLLIFVQLALATATILRRTDGRSHYRQAGCRGTDRHLVSASARTRSSRLASTPRQSRDLLGNVVVLPDHLLR